MEVDSARIEIERINNMICNFDWRISKQEIFDDRVILTIEKKIQTSTATKKPATGD